MVVRHHCVPLKGHPYPLKVQVFSSVHSNFHACMRFPSHLNLIGKTIPQNSVLYLPRDFEENNQRLQSSSTGPVGEKKNSEKTSGGLLMSLMLVVNIFSFGHESPVLATFNKEIAETTTTTVRIMFGKRSRFSLEIFLLMNPYLAPRKIIFNSRN